jgi:hypothetical protein
MKAQLRVVQQLRHHVPLGLARGLGQLEIDQKTMAVLHQRVASVELQAIPVSVPGWQVHRSCVI